MKISCQELLLQFPENISAVHGDPNAVVDHLATPQQSGEGGLLFLGTPKVVSEAKLSNAPVVVTSEALLEEVEQLGKPWAVLITSNVSFAMSRISQVCFGWNYHRPYEGKDIHPSAVIAGSAEIGANSIIGPNVCIGEHVHVGQGCFVGANTIIEDHVYIGDHSTIHPLVYIGVHARLGQQVVIHPNTTLGSEGYGFATDDNGNHFRIPQTGSVVLADRVEIGANCAIDAGTIEPTRMDEGTKLDNLCHIAHNTQIGKNGFVTACFATAGSSRFGDNFATGGCVSSAGHITVADNVTVAGRSVIHNDIRKPGVYGGHPLLPFKEYMRLIASLKRVPQMHRVLKRICRKLGVDF